LQASEQRNNCVDINYGGRVTCLVTSSEGISRLLKELDIRLDDHRVKMLYDHTQAIGIVNQGIRYLYTKLQHVNTTISVWWPSPPSKK
jgi:hypothetical protein